MANISPRSIAMHATHLDSLVMPAWVTMAPRGESASLHTSFPRRRFQIPTQFLVTVTASGRVGDRLWIIIIIIIIIIISAIPIILTVDVFLGSNGNSITGHAVFINRYGCVEMEDKMLKSSTLIMWLLYLECPLNNEKKKLCLVGGISVLKD